jgi:hypothetical protein
MRQMILTVLVATMISLSACAQQAPTTPEVTLTSEEVLAYLAELSSNAIGEVSLQVSDLDEKIAEVEEREAKLAEIRAALDEVITYLDEEMTSTNVQNNQYYYYAMPEEYLASYQNDCYELVKFERQYHYSQDFQDNALWNTFQETTIMDKASGAKDTPEVFESRLAMEKSPYVRQKTARLEAAEKASAVLNDMLQYADSWEITDEGNEICSVSGYGLGYTDQLTAGSWLYYLGPNIMEPQSPDSLRLKDIITTKT